MEDFYESGLACNVGYPEDTVTRHDVFSGFISEDVIWKERVELGVKFIRTVPDNWLYNKSGMNTGNIISWANIWSDRGNGLIPKFIHVKDPNAPADIRVMFNCELICTFRSLTPKP